MEDLSYKELNLVLDALVTQHVALKKKLQRHDISEEDAADATTDLCTYESLITFFEREKEAQMDRAQADVAKKFDLEAIREQIRKEAT